ncbi:hypothetical protein SAMN04490248_11922 [Salinihabitans flavidus]|uniref:Uncharacterized protein n=1 Tax=Salinihabitans flavidus TaxID=569882 RepID=A0A1H8UBH2_9RHOB|nr:hypothetical protein [Salinihabitans flavidus]SEP00377.1 hypothetical protein SAMN04490248_11922 [Salinihabitans flavidus]
MRYHVMKVQNLSPLFRGLRLSGKQWLDRQAPGFTGTLRLLGPEAGAITPVLRDRTGAVIECAWQHPDPPDPGDLAILRQPPENRLLLQGRFEFPEVGPLEIVDSTTDTILATLTPGIAFPDHIFDLLEETRLSGFAPLGFANFVETGTLFGHTTLHASYWFDHVTTIELSEVLHAQALKHLAHRPNVTCLQGNSAERLPEVIAGLEGASFFFLDAHWSGDNSVDWGASNFKGYPAETARIEDPSLPEGERQVPLLSELRAIAEGHTGAALVLIDDWQTPGLKDANFAGEDWSHIDPARLIDWMAAHPRTHAHFRASWNRYVWQLDPA